MHEPRAIAKTVLEQWSVAAIAQKKSFHDEHCQALTKPPGCITPSTGAICDLRDEIKADNENLQIR